MNALLIGLFPALPEITLAVSALILLLVGAFRGDRAMGMIAAVSGLVLVLAAALVSFAPLPDGASYNGMFMNDGFARFAKVLIAVGGVLALLMSGEYLTQHKVARFEYPILILLASVGMFFMVSSNDLMSLYVGLELQSLALYVLAAFKRDSVRSSEAGLKYFVLGALSSGMLLYGASLVYGYAGTTNFDLLAERLAVQNASIGIIIGLVFVAAGLAFKIAAVPFHMWTPDVYEGAPTPVTAFFAVAAKVAAVVLLVRVFAGPFAPLVEEWRQIVIVMAMASMLLGAFAALTQTNIKRLLAYSSIGHAGFALVGLAAGTEEGVRSVLIYMAIYIFMSAGAFACVLAMRRKDGMVESIEDLAGLSRSHPGMAFALAAFMLSLAGIPPLAGFFGKFYVFMAAVNAGLYALAVVGVIASVIGTYYYLRIIKVMYFDPLEESFVHPLAPALGWTQAGTALLVTLFFIYPAPLIQAAGRAAAALMR